LTADRRRGCCSPARALDVCNRASQFILRTAPVAEPGQRPSVDHEVFTEEEAGLGIDRLDVGSAPRRRGPSSYVNCPKEMTFSPRDQLPTIQQANGPRKSRSNNGMKFSATSWLKRIPPNARRLSLDRWPVGSLARWLVGSLDRWIVGSLARSGDTVAAVPGSRLEKQSS
jgi:hypothetical protein